ncbi:Rrf2 family transcriptional regulator [Candidatus Fermentibacteria bacterium]|nr:Rrf2 family transcriptional regulator [Candidatus Fermentibacteria bacterium]
MAFDLGLSQAANLAVHAGLLLAEESEGDGGRLTVAEMSESLSVSRSHLAKVLQRLAREGLVESCRGRAGGFRLARPAFDISLMELVEAVDGPSLTGGCLLGDPVCRRGECVLSNLVDEVGNRVIESLSEATLMEFVCSQNEGA